MTMVRSIIPLAAAAATLGATVDARTTVAVLEVGQGGVVRRTAVASPHASVHGVASFFNAVHDHVGGKAKARRSTQHPGMAMVPDLFSRADGGIALGISGSAVDLADFPHLTALLENESTVGTFEIAGSHAKTLLKKAGSKANDVVSDASEIVSSLKAKASAATKNQLQSLSVTVNDKANASGVDSGIAAVVSTLQKESAEAGKTLLLHLVIEEEEIGSMIEDELLEHKQQFQSSESGSTGPHGRRLEDMQQNNNNNNWNVQYSSSSGYGQRTIFEIQYFNVVLWSAIGLLIILLTAVYMMMYMPLMADTLLFGESAKMVAE